MEIITQDGRERVVLEKAEYEDLVDARDHAVAMRDIAGGGPTLSGSDMDSYLASPTPLAFWRERAGKTQAALAAEAGVPSASLASIEAGEQEGSAVVLARLARALNVRIDDLIVD